ncbi:hypothetical protein B0H17DRAFT_1200954 [Mycena rosella]|uniref:Uncharacterized protein n=1 Tax=Mycena rosella TaxID=1033263 RepID=A0AAD7DI94_MYCRO|nr:hypothetical protein B0H17DRAFT_1200954 [Mycena rosella]
MGLACEYLAVHEEHARSVSTAPGGHPFRSRPPPSTPITHVQAPRYPHTPPTADSAPQGYGGLYGEPQPAHSRDGYYLQQHAPQFNAAPGGPTPGPSHRDRRPHHPHYLASRPEGQYNYEGVQSHRPRTVPAHPSWPSAPKPPAPENPSEYQQYFANFGLDHGHMYPSEAVLVWRN